MKALLHIQASLRTSYSPYCILDVPDGSTQEQLIDIAANILPSLYGSADSVDVDEDGVCWKHGEYWYVDDIKPLSDEDADHLTRILGISTF